MDFCEFEVRVSLGEDFRDVYRKFTEENFGDCINSRKELLSERQCTQDFKGKQGFRDPIFGDV